ncbi:hypothetical protein [Halostagnicola kamekurae]|uniref:Uncharacterized protein n=1 Tax=Halostagnicola kamekurae TaxID=619731 RepID=A0A1I6QUQ6_9EURY|nr:hypothetical protein [Halostagnicola kamekurae]SFS56226.1 hypothetical protein SAMN04488556_1588 [Halostagnicola kamekurae]
MTDWEHITLKVEPDTKEEWKKYAEEHPEAGNLSHLIRLSVHNEMNTESELDDAHVPKEDERIGELIESVNQIHDTLDTVQARISTLEHDSEVTEGFDMQKAVLSFLPTPPESALVPNPDSTGSHVYNDADFDEWAATPEGISEQLGSNEADVRDALQRLESVTGLVDSKSSDSQIYYWKKE